MARDTAAAGLRSDLDEDAGTFWGFLRASMIRGYPYFILLVLSVIGICWANLAHNHSTAYWVAMAPICALVCVFTGWRKSSEQHSILRLFILQAGQWAAVMVAMYLVAVSDLRDLLNDDARGLMMLTLLALGLFISGLNLEIWQLCVLGMFLAVSVPMIAWVEAASVLLFLLATAVIGVVLLRLWIKHKYA